MEKILSNRILKNTLLGFFVLAIFLTPVSFHTDTSGAVVLSLNESLAQAKEASLWTFFANPGQAVGNIMLSAASFFTWMGGLFLDTALEYTVFRMGDSVNTSGLRDTINALWTLIRDICNLAFIFGFIYIGISTIIEPDSASTKRFLSRIIIGALLINFSLFFAKAVVDFSNFTAYQVYNSMTIVPTAEKVSLSEAITQKLGVVTLYNVGNGEILSTIAENKSFSFFAGASLFLLITAFVFFAGALLLIIRFVTLILIMVASPILFAATVFPQTEPFAKDLRKKLISQSFFAPAYLLLVLISIKMIEGLGLSGGNFAGELSGTAGGNFSSALNFIIIIFFMISALTIASKMGVKGGEMAVKFAGGMSFGLAARLGRATAGRFAHSISERDGLKDAASQNTPRGWAARQILMGSRAVGDTSFDIRNANKDLSKKLGLGEGRKGGYETVQKEVGEKEMKFAKSLGEISDPEKDQYLGERKKALDKAENNLRSLQDLRSSTNNPDQRKQLASDIRDAEKDIKEKREAFEREKQRRVLGRDVSDVDNIKEVEQVKTRLKETEETMKEAWKQYREAPDGDEREAIGYTIDELNKKLAESRKEFQAVRSKHTVDGYADVLKNSKWFTAWPKGRIIAHEKEAGDSIRKAFEKKIKKSKEDARTDAVVEAVKSSSKSE